jgi:Na+-transporting methylmalonyl-CoA/oxaloacetate decarboxylase gamma subunit
MKLHVIFIVLHILALFTLGIGLLITIPAHIVLAIKQNKKKAAETQIPPAI